MIIIMRCVAKNLEVLPEAIRDTLVRRIRCSCKNEEVDLYNVKDLGNFYLCRNCGLIKKYEEEKC